METSVPDALRRVAALLDTLPGLPDQVVTVYSHAPYVGILFGAGPRDDERLEAVARVLAALGAPPPRQDALEFRGQGMLGPYRVEVATGFD